MTLRNAERITGLEVQRVADKTFAALDPATGHIVTTQYDKRGNKFALQAIVDAVWEKRKLECLERDGWKCVKCGCDRMLTVNHKIKRSHGRSDDLSNLETLCIPCHDEVDNGFKHKR